MPHRDPSATELIEQVVRSILRSEARLDELKAEAEATEVELGELRITRRVLEGILGRAVESPASESPTEDGAVEEADTEEEHPSTGPAQPEVTPWAPTRRTGSTVPLRRSKVAIPEAAAEVIRKAGVELHQTEIAAQLLAAGYPYKGPADRLPDTVGKVLARRAKEGKQVVRTGPGTFALREWVQGGEKEADAPDPGEQNLFAPDAEPEERVA